MSMKGTLQTTKTNDYGFTAVKVGGAWYGADKKGFKPDAQEGDLVEFEAFANAKGYQTYKAASFKKVERVTNSGPGGEPSGGTVNAAGPSVSSGNGGWQASAGTRDTYWADKAKADEAKDPRIVYQSSYERAIAFTDLAIRNGAFEALAKAKPAARLEVLQSFVDEQAARIMGQVYLAEVPKANDVPTVKEVTNTVGTTTEIESDEDWS